MWSVGVKEIICGYWSMRAPPCPCWLCAAPLRLRWRNTRWSTRAKGRVWRSAKQSWRNCAGRARAASTPPNMETRRCRSVCVCHCSVFVKLSSDVCTIQDIWHFSFLQTIVPGASLVNWSFLCGSMRNKIYALARWLKEDPYSQLEDHWIKAHDNMVTTASAKKYDPIGFSPVCGADNLPFIL